MDPLPGGTRLGRDSSRIVTGDLVDPEVDPADVPGLKFGTPRNYARRTLGHQQAAFSRIWVGQRCPCGESGWMPWQRLVGNVLGEVDDLGRRVYGFGLVTVQRQAGKSLLVFVRNAERGLSVPGYQSWYTAQTGQDAADELVKFYDVVLDKKPLQRLVHLTRSRGSERLTYPTGSMIRAHPPSEEKLHGKQSDGNDVDEGWAFSREEWALLLQAIAPTQLTRPDPQTIAWSAGGTPTSTALADLVAQLRQSMTTGGIVSIGGIEVPFAGFEFGIPDDSDAEDLDVILEHHPARGHTITREALLRLRAQLPDPDGWARAAGNRWSSVINSAIDARMWERTRYPDPLPDDATLGWGAARAEDGSHVVIACATQLDDGRVVAEVADVLPTAYRAADVVAEWVDLDRVSVDPSGPSSTLAEDLGRKALPSLDVLSSRQASAACQDLLDGMAEQPPRVMFRRHDALDAAVAVAQKRRVSDGGVAWSRSTATGSIAALEAVTYAVRSAKVPRRTGRPSADPRDTPT